MLYFPFLIARLPLPYLITSLFEITIDCVTRLLLTTQKKSAIAIEDSQEVKQHSVQQAQFL
jgi:hypothetical protein